MKFIAHLAVSLSCLTIFGGCSVFNTKGLESLSPERTRFEGKVRWISNKRSKILVKTKVGLKLLNMSSENFLANVNGCTADRAEIPKGAIVSGWLFHYPNGNRIILELTAVAPDHRTRRWQLTGLRSNLWCLGGDVEGVDMQERLLGIRTTAGEVISFVFSDGLQVTRGGDMPVSKRIEDLKKGEHVEIEYSTGAIKNTAGIIHAAGRQSD